MKNSKKTILLLVMILLSGVGVYSLVASDHIDAPGVRYTGDTKSDITDLYVFESPQDTNNLVFVCNVQGLYAAGTNGVFDPNVLVQFKIDNNNDNVEDLVIQCTYESNTLTVHGPAAPIQTGLQSKVVTSGPTTSVAISSGAGVTTGTNSNGMKIYAGPRDDPFFFDLVTFKHVIAGDTTAFHNPGTDTFAGTNILSTVVEVPKSLLPGGVNNMINVWATTSR